MNFFRGNALNFSIGGQVMGSPLTPDPLAIFGSNLKGWWDIKSGSIWTDSARTTPATVNDDVLGAVDDLSGNSKHGLQPTAANKLLLKTAQLPNGNPAALNDGVNDYFDVGSSFAFRETQALTIGIVPKRGNTAAQFGAYFYSLSAGEAFPGIGIYKDFSTHRLSIVFSNLGSTNFLRAQSTTVVSSANFQSWVITYSGSGTAAGFKMFLNGVQETLITTDTLAGVDPTPILPVGRLFGLSTATVLMYNKELFIAYEDASATAGKVAASENWLKTNNGL